MRRMQHQNPKMRGKIRIILINVLKWMLIFPIYAYRSVISPLFPPTCRFAPTCSQYAIEAISKYGPFRGFLLAIKRICRCHPWGGSGFDPVP